MKMRKTLALLLAALMTLSMAACGQKGGSGSTAGTSNPGSSSAAPAGSNAPSGDVAMQYMAQDELDAVLGDEGYLVVDVRKAADYETAHIPGAISADMDAAVNGDTAAGVETMTAATKDVDDTLVLVCYSGKKYAQAATNALSQIGYDMSKVYTLEGGFNAWTEGLSKEYPMQYMTAEELNGKLGADGYTILDVRKAADYETSHIPGAVSADMDAVISGEDVAAGVVTMDAATDGLDDTLVVICYSGKRYAQATTNTLAKLGYDMSKVYTLEGGFKGWSETYPDTVEP